MRSRWPTARTHLNRLILTVGLIVALPVVPLAERLRAGAGQRVARAAVRLLARACGVSIDVTGAALDEAGGYVFVPNHSSALDIPAMLLAHPQIRFLAAAELFDIPLLGRAMRALGAMPIDRRDRGAARRQLAAATAAEPACLVVFAEGGIAPAGSRLPFKTGAFALAIARGTPVVPVAIHGTADLLGPGRRLAVRPGTVTVEVLEPIPTDGLRAPDRRQLRDRTQASVLRALGRAAA